MTEGESWQDKTELKLDTCERNLCNFIKEKTNQHNENSATSVINIKHESGKKAADILTDTYHNTTLPNYVTGAEEM